MVLKIRTFETHIISILKAFNINHAIKTLIHLVVHWKYFVGFLFEMNCAYKDTIKSKIEL